MISPFVSNIKPAELYFLKDYCIDDGSTEVGKFIESVIEEAIKDTKGVNFQKKAREYLRNSKQKSLKEIIIREAPKFFTVVPRFQLYTGELVTTEDKQFNYSWYFQYTVRTKLMACSKLLPDNKYFCYRYESDQSFLFEVKDSIYTQIKRKGNLL